eukprot:scaffold33488_cov32-Tisochrysis_lutea.AAC.3
MGGSRHDKSRKPGINPKLSGHIDCTHGRDLYWLMMLVISERAALMPVITPHGTRYYAIVSSMSPRRWRRFGASSWVNGSKACADGKGSDGFHTATALLEQGEAEGLFSLGARQSGICSLLNMCTGKMERNETWDADVVINHHIHDADREDPSVIAAIGAVYCAGTRSPF